jgi:hypothetical protein
MNGSNEIVKTPGNQCIQYLTQVTQMTSGTAKENFGRQLRQAKEVSVIRTSDLPEKVRDVVLRVAEIVHPYLRQCYRNAQLFANAFPENEEMQVRYVEGYFFYALPIEHAFNVVAYRGKEYYIDITTEFANPGAEATDYISVHEFSKQEIFERMLNAQEHRCFYLDVFREDAENNKR